MSPIYRNAAAARAPASLSLFTARKGGSGSGVCKVFHGVCNGDTLLSASLAASQRLAVLAGEKAFADSCGAACPGAPLWASESGAVCCNASAGARADSGFSCSRSTAIARVDTVLSCDAGAGPSGHILARLRRSAMFKLLIGVSAGRFVRDLWLTCSVCEAAALEEGSLWGLCLGAAFPGATSRPSVTPFFWASEAGADNVSSSACADALADYVFL